MIVIAVSRSLGSRETRSREPANSVKMISRDRQGQDHNPIVREGHHHDLLVKTCNLKTQDQGQDFEPQDQSL